MYNQLSTIVRGRQPLTIFIHEQKEEVAKELLKKKVLVPDEFGLFSEIWIPLGLQSFE
jgi:hypothetical protein